MQTMETSDGALLGRDTVVSLIGSADGDATDGDDILLGIEPGTVDNTADCTVLGIEVGESDGAIDGAMLGIELGTVDGCADEGVLLFV